MLLFLLQRVRVTERSSPRAGPASAGHRPSRPSHHDKYQTVLGESEEEREKEREREIRRNHNHTKITIQAEFIYFLILGERRRSQCWSSNSETQKRK